MRPYLAYRDERICKLVDKRHVTMKRAANLFGLRYAHVRQIMSRWRRKEGRLSHLSASQDK